MPEGSSVSRHKKIWHKTAEFRHKSKVHIRGTDVHFSKGIFMKKFLRKDTYIILINGAFVNSFFESLQKVNIHNWIFA